MQAHRSSLSISVFAILRFSFQVTEDDHWFPTRAERKDSLDLVDKNRGGCC